MKRRVICWTVKEIVHPKMKSCHHLLTLMQFRNLCYFSVKHKSSYLLYSKNQATLFHTMKMISSAVKLWFKLKFSLYLTQSYNCQTCVPMSCVSLPPMSIYVFACSPFPVCSLIIIPPSCVWFLLTCFSSPRLFPSILKPWFSPCLMSGIVCLTLVLHVSMCLCFIKGRFVCTPRLLAPCGVVTIIWHWKTWNILHKL